ITLDTAPGRLSEPDRGRRNPGPRSQGIRPSGGLVGDSEEDCGVRAGDPPLLPRWWEADGNQPWPCTVLRRADMRLLGLRPDEPLDTSSPDCLRARPDTAPDSWSEGTRCVPPDSERLRSEEAIDAGMVDALKRRSPAASHASDEGSMAAQSLVVTIRGTTRETPPTTPSSPC
ncbi:unnamed protein product, partial [Ixodes pacificus]